MPPSLVVRVSGNLDALKKSLKEGEQAIQATSAQAQKLATSFNGDRMVTHAKNVTAAIREVGVTTLTASQASRNLDLLERAMDKMRLTSQPIPANMKATAEQLHFVARSAEAAVPAGQQVTAVYRQFDGVLQSMGINIGPYVKGIEDVTTAVTGMKMAGGATTTMLGLFAPALAVVATAIGAWKFGTKIGEVNGFTEAIARGIAVMKGYGDVQQETAMAIADANDLAGKAEANWKRQTQSIADSTKAAKDQSDAIKQNWLVTDGNRDALARLSRAIDEAKVKRLEDARAAFAASQAQSAFTDNTKTATDAVVKQTAALEAREESLRRIAEAGARQRQAEADFMKYGSGGPPDDPKKTVRTLGGEWITPDEAEKRRTMGGTMDIPPLTGWALDEVVDRFNRAGDQSPDQALWRALDSLESLEGRQDGPKSNQEFFQRQRDAVLLAQLRDMLQGRDRPPGFAGGVENFSGGMAMVGERGPELVRLPGGSDVIPNHALGTTITIAPQIVFRGPVMGSAEALRSMVTDVIRRALNDAGMPLPVR